MVLEVKCEKCGASQEYKPGSHQLRCSYCEHITEITAQPTTKQAHTELDLTAYLNDLSAEENQGELHVVACDSCGAQCEFKSHQQSSRCPFCNTALVLSQAQTKKHIAPAGLLPFGVDRHAAKELLKAWCQKRWFAPGDMSRQILQHEKFEGVYLPFWTFDCATRSDYIGQRGDEYSTSDDTASTAAQQSETEIRWSEIRGCLEYDFDDLLLPGTHSLSHSQLNALAPWDLAQLVDYKDEYLSGFITETYSVDIKRAYEQARKLMNKRIEREVKHKIGGDRQKITAIDTQFNEASFKHILLPLWLSTYRYGDKTYQVLVNARTGEVHAERPWSWLKITGAILLLATLVGGWYAYKAIS